MKTNRLFTTIAFTLLFLLSGVSLAQEATNIIEFTTISSRAHHTWEGDYKFSGETIVKISGLQDLHVLKYRRLGGEGDLVDFAQDSGKNKLRILLEADTNLKGVVPVFESVDVLPVDDGAEIIVRWRHPGNGGFRRAEKYRYTASGLMLIIRSEFMEIDGQVQWISAKALARKAAETKTRYPAVREVSQKNAKENFRVCPEWH